MAFPPTLDGLTTREAVIDAVFRVTLAFDNADAKLLESAMTADAVLDVNGQVTEGLNNLLNGSFERIGKLDTTHYTTNIRVTLKEGETAASLTANFLAQHYREGEGMQPGATRYLAGGFYFIELVKDQKDGLWKAKHWKLQSIWGEGEYGVLTGK
ncbi:hypothetical protein LTR29_016497 [Friedmanniomyces endolithicus]|nr:hypothetical protein LTR29_016497 [Friedmanniomyces endolithicus]